MKARPRPEQSVQEEETRGTLTVHQRASDGFSRSRDGARLSWAQGASAVPLPLRSQRPALFLVPSGRMKVTSLMGRLLAEIVCETRLRYRIPRRGRLSRAVGVASGPFFELSLIRRLRGVPSLDHPPVRPDGFAAVEANGAPRRPRMSAAGCSHFRQPPVGCTRDWAGELPLSKAA